MLRTRLNAVASCRNCSDCANSGSARRFSLQIGDRHVERRGRARREHGADVAAIGAALLEDELRAARAGTRSSVGPDLVASAAQRVALPARLVASSASSGTRRRMPGQRLGVERACRRMPCAWRRSPNGSRDPVGRSPARNRPTSVSSLSASDTAAHVTRAGAERLGRRRGASASTRDRQVVVVDRLPHRFRLAGLARVDAAHHALQLGELAHHVGREVGLRQPRRARGRVGRRAGCSKHVGRDPPRQRLDALRLLRGTTRAACGTARVSSRRAALRARPADRRPRRTARRAAAPSTTRSALVAIARSLRGLRVRHGEERRHQRARRRRPPERSADDGSASSSALRPAASGTPR